MRHRSLLACFVAAGLLLGTTTGCDGTKAQQGVPKDIDFSKDFSPAAKPIGIDPKAAEKDAAAKKKAAAKK